MYADHITTYYRSDQVGSARLTSSYHGYLTWSGTYLPFGQEWSSQMTVNHYKFTRSTHSVRSGQAGLERDSESGLDHTWFRKYSSGYGRWLSPDPLAGGITNPQSLNRYAYVNNNPVNSTDPSGLFIAPLTYPLFRSAGAAFYYPGGLTFGVSGCTLDGLDSPCSLVVHAILAGATDVRPESVVQTGSNTFQVWIPGGCVSASDNLGNTLSPSCDPGYWATLTLGAQGAAGDAFLNADAAQILSQVYQNTRGLTNPTNIVAFYGASAVLGGAGVAAGAYGTQVASKLAAAIPTVIAVEQQILADPKLVTFLSDFIQGYAPGAVPATLGGLAGFVASNLDNLIQAGRQVYHDVKGSVPH